jgi:hypothetical protein
MTVAHPSVGDFVAAWRRGERPRLEDFLVPGDATGDVLLHSLVRAELACRLEAGEAARVETYLERIPNLLHEPTAVLDLIELEYVLRRRSEPALAWADYPDRFPQFRDELRARSPSGSAQAGWAESFTGLASSPTVVRATIAHAGVEGPAAEPVALPSSVGGYALAGEVGRGGMGVVYRAFDCKRGLHVALKTLPRLDPVALDRFKNEFRVLAGVTHPNLVTLYELFTEGQQWFFAMEFVDGVNFLTYVREGLAAPRTSSTVAYALEAGPDESGGPEASPLSPGQLDRLRAGLRQLAAGVQAIHDAGKLHRDIKPSNTLVTPAGRVVLLDFGLAAELDAASVRQTAEGAVVGTVSYMAPEQAAGRSLSPASDWYSVGVMLYEALTIRRPFTGPAMQVVRDKQEMDPHAPAELVPGIPDDLNALCVALLNRRPDLRPSGPEVLRRLGAAVHATPLPLRALATTARTFVGRDRHLQALADAYQSLRGGRTVTVNVRGRSGVGKSALVQRFLEEVSTAGDAVVLAGRCYEHESVPYKALDSLVDALARYLRRLPEPEARSLLPADLRPLARIFPVLRGLRPDRDLGERDDAPDPHELRRRAFAALRALLARLGAHRPLVLAIDDLQWGDVDSAALLAELLRPPAPPRLLLLASFRSEDVAASPFLRAFLSPQDPADAAPEHRDLAVEPLTSAETRELAIRLLGRDDPKAQTQAETIARESGGSPFFLAELVEHLQEGSEPAHPATGAVSLDDVLWKRVTRLPEEARRLLEVVAVAGQPLRQGDACAAARLAGDERPALAVLASGRFLRSTGATEHDDLEAYHDRVRESVVGRLAPDTLAGHHGRLAEVLEAAGQCGPEVLAAHFHGARQPAKAGRCYALAATQATEALAFERAAKLYRLALDLGPSTTEEAHRLRTGLADALANAGRGAEAGREYQAVAAAAPPAEAVELRRRAAFQFLGSGHVDEGLRVIREVLGAVGMRLAATPRRALLGLLFRRALLWLRGYGFRERDASQVPAKDLARIDICWCVCSTLGTSDAIRGNDFQTRHLLLALRAGEPYRIARALAVEGAYLTSTGGRARQRAARLLETAEAIARRIDQPYALGVALLCKTMFLHMAEQWERARQAGEQCETVFRTRCTGVAWELATARIWTLWELGHLGEVAELGRRCRALVPEAQARGDVHTLTYLRSSCLPLALLAADDPDTARRDIQEGLAQWSQSGYHLQHYAALLMHVLVERYAGRPEAAWELVTTQGDAFARALLIRIQEFRIQVLQARAYTALAAAAVAADPGPLWRDAGQTARRLRREKQPWALATADYVEAALAAARGERQAAAALLPKVVAQFEALQMGLYAAATRRRLGELVGGSAGRALVAEADAWMAGQAIKDPVRMAATIAPPLPGAPTGASTYQGTT